MPYGVKRYARKTVRKTAYRKKPMRRYATQTVRRYATRTVRRYAPTRRTVRRYAPKARKTYRKRYHKDPIMEQAKELVLLKVKQGRVDEIHAALRKAQESGIHEDNHVFAAANAQMQAEAAEADAIVQSTMGSSLVQTKKRKVEHTAEDPAAGEMYELL